MFRIAYFVSHPIHYLVPLFRKLTSHLEVQLNVYFFCDEGIKEYFNPELNMRYQWDENLLRDYTYEVLPNMALRPSASTFLGTINFGIFKILKENRFDAIVVQGWASLSCWFVFLAAKAFKIPFYVFGDSVHLYPESKLKTRFKKWILTPVTQWSQGLLISGAFNKNYYLKYGADEKKFWHFPWSVDNETYFILSRQLKPQRAALRNKWDIFQTAIVVLYVGKLVERKRPMDLLRAAKDLCGRHPLFFLFAGEGPQKQELIDTAQKNRLDNVRFLGFCNRTQIPDLYALSDIFVLPSERDPRGTVTNEAMAFGLPVVVSNGVGIWGEGDILRNGENGYVYPVGNISLLTQALITLCENERLRTDMGNRSREIISRWSYDVGVEHLLSALRQHQEQPQIL